MRRTKYRILLTLVFIFLLLGLTACTKSNKDSGNTQPSPTLAATAAPTTAPTATPTVAPTPTPVPVDATPTKAAGFYVDGTKLFDVNGNEFIMRGVSHAHTWYKGNTDTALKAIAATGANSVRIVLSDGVQWTKDDAATVKKIIDECKELKMIAVLEVHDATGKNSAEDLNKAVDYWISLKDILIGNEAYVIINIANEWYGDWNSKAWADAYIAAIPKLRAAGFSHTILVDSAGWGQYAKSLEEKGADILAADPLKNTMFAIHMYEYAGKDAATIKANIDNARNKNLCVTIGEFGFKHTDGDVDEAYIMEYCNEIGVGYMGWSWKGNGGGVEYLDIAKTWDGSELSADWGENLINGDYGIRKTSKICTVFQ